LIDDLSVSITNLINGHKSSAEFKEEWFDPAAILADSSNNEQLSLRRFSGLFIITGCVSVLMLLISVTRFVYAKYTRVRGSESRSADGGSGGSRKESNAPLMGTAMLDQHIQEVRDYDSQGTRGSGGSTVDEEAGASAMQDSLSSNGSVPQVSVHIEMTSTGQGVR
jgi:hypothetical protein